MAGVAADTQRDEGGLAVLVARRNRGEGEQHRDRCSRRTASDRTAATAAEAGMRRRHRMEWLALGLAVVAGVAGVTLAFILDWRAGLILVGGVAALVHVA